MELWREGEGSGSSGSGSCLQDGESNPSKKPSGHHNSKKSTEAVVDEQTEQEVEEATKNNKSEPPTLEQTQGQARNIVGNLETVSANVLGITNTNKIIPLSRRLSSRD